MSPEEVRFVVALRRRRRVVDRVGADHWDTDAAGERVRSARRALLDLGYDRDHLRHLEECALPVDAWIARLGDPVRLGQLRRLSLPPALRSGQEAA